MALKNKNVAQSRLYRVAFKITLWVLMKSCIRQHSEKATLTWHCLKWKYGFKGADLLQFRTGFSWSLASILLWSGDVVLGRRICQIWATFCETFCQYTRATCDTRPGVYWSQITKIGVSLSLGWLPLTCLPGKVKDMKNFIVRNMKSNT